MVFEKVAEILSAQFGIDLDQITEETDIINDLGADSLDIVELMMSLENEFGLLITDEMTADVHTVGEVAEVIERLLDQQP